MLKGIICEKFKQPKITFHKGLNTILGSQFGDNSIGKSTMLMIIDFVFGGSDYMTKSLDVHSNVGKHEFKIHFVFKNTDFYFVRNNTKPNIVFECDENYNSHAEMGLDEYKEFLANKYAIKDLSFRDCTSLYSRIYGRDNLNEHEPLNVRQKMSDEKAILTLVKLFGNYKMIQSYENICSEQKNKLSSFQKAQKYNYIPSLSAIEVKKKKQELESLNKNIIELTNKYDQSFADVNSSLSEAAIDIKNKLAITRKQKTKEETRLLAIQRSRSEESVITRENFEELKAFFPSVNIKKLESIELFHKSINKVLKKEQDDEIKALKSKIEILEKDILSLEEDLKSMLNTTSVTKAILKNFTYLQKQKETIENQISFYEQKKALENSKKVAEENYENMLQTEENKIQSIINSEILKINEKIYGSEFKSPSLSLQKTSYSYYTPDDSGTGTNYKNLIVLDFSILNLTQLPYMIHDSILLKQIADNAIERILELYNNTTKQIFISLDKQTSYTKKTQEILDSSCVLTLYPNGGELFGRAWNRKVK